MLWQRANHYRPNFIPHLRAKTPGYITSYKVRSCLLSGLDGYFYYLNLLRAQIPITVAHFSHVFWRLRKIFHQIIRDIEILFRINVDVSGSKY